MSWSLWDLSASSCCVIVVDNAVNNKLDYTEQVPARCARKTGGNRCGAIYGLGHYKDECDNVHHPQK